jgi:uncharacterized surface protein with fasciclin (FAS1) repeats
MKKLVIAAAAAMLAASPAFAKDCGSKSKASTADAGMSLAHPAAAMIPVGYAKAEAAAAGTIVDVAAGNADFSTLVAAVKAADLATVLSGEGPFTVFAPTNAAFAALPAGAVEDLLKPENKAKLAGILTFHVLPAKVMAGDIADGVTEVATVNGAKVKIEKTAMGVTINGAKITATDIAGTNGVIHVIDAVIMPPAAGAAPM